MRGVLSKIKPRRLSRALALAFPIAALTAVAALAASGTVTKSVDVIDGTSNTATAACKGHVALGDWGFSTTMDPNKGVAISKLDPQRKQMVARATNLGNVTGQLHSIAHCAKQPKHRPNPAPKTVKKTVAVGDHATKTATASCPRGSAVRFGGFSASVEAGFNQKAVIVRSMQRTSARKWKVVGRNEGAEAGSLTAIARCVKGSLKLKKASKKESLTELGGGGNSATATCPGNDRVVMAGFTNLDGTASGIYLNGLDRASAHTVTAKSFSFVPTDLTAIAYCR